MRQGGETDDGGKTGGITRSATRLGAATFLSKVSGLARDTAFAVLFGTGFVADAFNLAFLLPNFLRSIVGEGNLNPSFVPVFTEIRVRRGEAAAARFHRRAIGAHLAVLALLTLLGIAAASLLVRIYARDWEKDPEGFSFAVFLLRILFPSLLFAGGAALTAAALNARRHFVVPALSPILLNVFFLLGAAAALPFGTLEERAVLFSIGGLVGGLAAWIVQFPKARSLGVPLLPAWRPTDPDVIRMARLMLPGLVALGVTQLNLFVDTLLALRLEEGSLTALRLANRVTILPLGVIGVAVSTASLPALALRAARDDRPALLDALGHTIRLLLTLLVPAGVGLILLAEPIVTLLFQYGEFSAERSTPMTVGAMRIYALGLPAYGLVKGLAQGFYSVQDTKTPVKIAAVATVVNIGLNLVLMGPFGLQGLALATVLAAYLNVSLLFWQLGRRVGRPPRGAVRRAVTRSLIASVALAAAGWAGLGLAEQFVVGGSILERGARVFLAIGAALAALLAAYRAMGHEEMREVLESLPGRRGGTR
jgi:putative peptidoglycan lipid II flippase